MQSWQPYNTLCAQLFQSNFYSHMHNTLKHTKHLFIFLMQNGTGLLGSLWWNIVIFARNKFIQNNLGVTPNNLELTVKFMKPRKDVADLSQNIHQNRLRWGIGSRGSKSSPDAGTVCIWYHRFHTSLVTVSPSLLCPLFQQAQ